MSTVTCIVTVIAIICIGLPSTPTDAKGISSSKRLKPKSKFSDTIDIDNSQHNGHHFVEGSGTDHDDDDKDDSDIFGNAEDGSGTFEGSGDQFSVSRPSTKCLLLLNSLNSRQQISSYVPRCTSSGEFAPIQCDGGTDECWCADKLGQQIPGTRKRAPDSPNCKKYDRKNHVTVDTPMTRSSSRPTTRTTRFFASTSTPPQQQIIVVMATKSNSIDQNNRIDQMPPYDFDRNGINIVLPDMNSNEIEPPLSRRLVRSPITSQPGILAGIISAAVVSLLCTVLLVMFIIYRLRRKHDQELYIVDKPKMGPVLNYASHCSDAYG